jgi:hypothetical protein
VVDPGYSPPIPGTSSLAQPGAASTGSSSRAASPTLPTSRALAPALAAASFVLSRSVAAWYFVTQAASSVGVYIIRAAPDLSALTGVIAASSTLCLWLSSKQPRQNKKRDNFVKKAKLDTYPDRGIRGFVSGFPVPLDGFYDGPSVEPPVGLVLLRAWADEAPGVLCTDEAIWPRVLTPDNGTLASGVDIAVPPDNEV